MSDLPEQLKERKSASPAIQILTGSHKGKQFRLLSSQIVIGRDSECDVVFRNNPHCSRYHARIQKKDGAYLIESLDPKNPILVNKKPVAAKLLKSKDKINIGNTKMLFVADSPPTAMRPSKSSARKKHAGKGGLTPPRLILAMLCVGALFLLLSKNETKTAERKTIDIRTEADILKEVESIKELDEEEKKNQQALPKEKAARVAFIKGFRDYGKGYFDRALKMFQHCLTLDKVNPLCQSYSRKSKIQIDRLIQKKIRLGNAYKKNKQYEACKAAFKSVETMIRDSKSAVYKEAVANKKLCETHLKNQI